MSLRSKLLQLKERIGSQPVSIEVEIDGVKEPFLFKRLSGSEVDNIQLHALRADGKGVDPKKLAGHAGRVLSRSLVEEDGKPYLTEQEANDLPQAMREALFRAASDLNNLNPKKDEESDSGE